MRLEEFFEKYARGRGVMIAEQLAKEIRGVLSVQAPVRISRSGKIVATTKAKPFAPPRRVSGKLQKSVKVVRTKHGARVVVFAPYAASLEYTTKWAGWPHKFVQVAMRKMGLRGRHS